MSDTFSEFAKEHRRALVSYARKMGNNDPEDVADEAIARVLRYRDRPESEWIKIAKGCVRHITIDNNTHRLGNNKRIPKREVEMFTHLPVGERSDLSSVDHEIESSEWNEVMNQLKCPIDRRIMLLVVEGYAPEDIAEKIGKCNRYVSNRICKQRKRLRAQFPELN